MPVTPKAWRGFAKIPPHTGRRHSSLLPGQALSAAYEILFIVVGLGMLFGGAGLFVNSAVHPAQSLGVSEAVIGLTIIAAGTSMPELTTSLLAAVRGHRDIAVGNIIGSNIFNNLGILGAAATLTPLSAPGISHLDVWVMVPYELTGKNSSHKNSDMICL